MQMAPPYAWLGITKMSNGHVVTPTSSRKSHAAARRERLGQPRGRWSDQWAPSVSALPRYTFVYAISQCLALVGAGISLATSIKPALKVR